MNGQNQPKRVGNHAGATPVDMPDDENVIGFPAVGTALGEASIEEILAAVSARPGDTQHRLRILEDRIRRQWLVLQEMVREHADLVRSAASAPALPVVACPVAEPTMMIHKPRSLVPPPRRLRRAG